MQTHDFLKFINLEIGEVKILFRFDTVNHQMK